MNKAPRFYGQSNEGNPGNRKIKARVGHTKRELDILYQISNAMRTTLKLDEILYIILTGVTCHEGLGFNRAALFLLNEEKSLLEGKMGIGPDTMEEANKVWEAIEKEKMTLDDLIRNFDSQQLQKSQWHNLIINTTFKFCEDSGVIFIVLTEKMPLHIKIERSPFLKNDLLVKLLNSEEMVIVPLLAKEKPTGLIVADNFITKTPITPPQIRMLSMFANQAGLAIENSKLYESILLQARKDSLTGLWNHGYFQEKLSELVENQIPLSLLMMDIDDFKIYNDTFGHQTGDQALKDIAQIITKSLRKMDLACRYGGEEFSVVLPYADKQEAKMIGERIRTNVEEFPFGTSNLTLSIGISSFPQDSQSKEELIKKADLALYKAKHQGKNRACIWS